MTSLADDARAGLLTPPRSLPPKYFYDARGSLLFDRICDTPEYYVTRTEAALLSTFAHDVIDTARPDHILELGAGSSRKTRHLLDACQARGQICAYWPFDVCETILFETANGLRDAYDWLTINILVGDYHAGLADLSAVSGRRLYVFLGSTIGNFDTELAVDFLRELRAQMNPDDALLLGADRVKDEVVLKAAYDDAAGITAEFNLNVLNVLNRELEADFEPAHFYHRADYNPGGRRMEMYLVSRRAQTVHLESLGETFELEAGEAILTEISRKFTESDLYTLLRRAGFAVAMHYQPDNGYFSLLLAHPHGD